MLSCQGWPQARLMYLFQIQRHDRFVTLYRKQPEVTCHSTIQTLITYKTSTIRQIYKGENCCRWGDGGRKINVSMLREGNVK